MLTESSLWLTMLNGSDILYELRNQLRHSPLIGSGVAAIGTYLYGM
jgi:hypothetical protein